MSHFLQEDDQRVENARAPLFVPQLSKDERRLLLRQNWKDHLRIVSGGSDRVVCLTCACKIYTCSRALLCPQPSRGKDNPGRSKAEANSARATVNVDDGAWGEPFYPWTEHAPRPDNREHDTRTSGLVHSDVVLAPNNPLSAAREKELVAAIQHIKPRLSDLIWDETQQMIDTVTTLRTRELPDGHGAFAADFADPDAEQEEEEHQLYARPHTMFSSQSHQNRARERRKTQGHASNPIVVGEFLAYTTDYTLETPQDQKQACWVGKILGIDAEECKVNIARWHTGTIDNLNVNKSSNPKYRAWTGANQREWIEVARVLQVFKLTPKTNRITKPIMRQIANALQLHAACQGGDPDIAVGQDVLENPSQIGSGDEEGDEEEFDEEANTPHSMADSSNEKCGDNGGRTLRGEPCSKKAKLQGRCQSHQPPPVAQQGITWTHECGNCKKQFRCVPHRPPGQCFNADTKPRDTAEHGCRCLLHYQTSTYFCSNACHWRMQYNRNMRW